MILAGKRFLTSNGKAVFILLSKVLIIGWDIIMLCEINRDYLHGITLKNLMISNLYSVL